MNTIDASSAARELGRRGGLKGGRARAQSLTPEQRSAAATKAACVRWGKPYLSPPSGEEDYRRWLEVLRHAKKAIEYHDAVCPGYDLREWIDEAISVNEGNQPR